MRPFCIALDVVDDDVVTVERVESVQTAFGEMKENELVGGRLPPAAGDASGDDAEMELDEYC